MLLYGGKAALGGLRWCHVRRTIRTLLTFEDAPDLLVLHVGGNDLGLVKLGDLRYNISNILGQLRLLLHCYHPLDLFILKFFLD